jgi:hypothetical protein
MSWAEILGLIAWSLLMYFCGYSDGKLQERTDNMFKTLDTLIDKVGAMLEPKKGGVDG